MKKSVHSKIFYSLGLSLAILLLAATNAGAQTYSTVKNGPWSSSSTWAGGIVPSRTIILTATVNIYNTVTFDVNGDLDVYGTLNIIGDTLRYADQSNRDLIVEATGKVNVLSGALVQDISKDGNLTINGGKVILNDAYVVIDNKIDEKVGSRMVVNSSSIQTGGNYTVDGTLLIPTIDTIVHSTIVVGTATGPDANLEIKDYATQYVSYASYYVNHDFHVNKNAYLLPVPGTTYGVDYVRVTHDFNNDGTFTAKVNNYCVGHNVGGTNAAGITYVRPMNCSLVADTATAVPELMFANPTLVSGTAGKEGAVYKFPSIAPGIDGMMKMAKFSRPDIYMANIDNSALGWPKAFQPEFGMQTVPANTKWFIDFELTFVQAGTTIPKTVDRFVATSLDVDGDGVNVAEFVTMMKPSSVTYSPVTYIQSAAPTVEMGTCDNCGKTSASMQCPTCLGKGKDAKGKKCKKCDGIGKVYSACGHPFDGIATAVVQGPTQNFLNIDTSATQVMATYVYDNKSVINFEIGAQSGSLNNYGAGVRLNSLWFKSFSLTQQVPLPVKLQSFTAVAGKSDVTLNWNTTEEEKFSHFVIERSTDGKEFHAIATVFPKSGSVGAATQYSYKDAAANVAGQVYFYRIQFVDQTDEASTSSIRTVRLGAANGSNLSIATYPNPATDHVSVSLPASWQGKDVSLELYNSSGLRVTALQKTNAASTENISLNSIAKGFYIVKASCGTETAQERVIKN